jgi:chemotaxis regulatin CheY-phosphate phosphatase CheZ
MSELTDLHQGLADAYNAIWQAVGEVKTAVQRTHDFVDQALNALSAVTEELESRYGEVQGLIRTAEDAVPDPTESEEYEELASELEAFKVAVDEAQNALGQVA